MGVQSPSTLPTLTTVYESEASEQTDPRKAHQTTIFSWKGFRIDPYNLSELFPRCFKQVRHLGRNRNFRTPCNSHLDRKQIDHHNCNPYFHFSWLTMAIPAGMLTCVTFDWHRTISKTITSMAFATIPASCTIACSVCSIRK